MRRPLRPKVKMKEVSALVEMKREEILKAEAAASDKALKMRPVGAYSRKKLDVVSKYLTAYSLILSKHFRRFWYVETCSGPGVCRVRASGRIVLGTPVLALSTEPRFTGYRFIELHPRSADALQRRKDMYFSGIDCKVEQGDCNQMLQKVLSGLPQNDPVFIVMDPQGLELKWNDVVVPASAMARSEMLINFPYDMAIKRCISPALSPSIEMSVTDCFGSDEWKAWRDDYLDKQISHDQLRDGLLNLYVKGLKSLGFTNTFPSSLVTGDKNHPLYYLVFASRKDVAGRIMKDIMKLDSLVQTHFS